MFITQYWCTRCNGYRETLPDERCPSCGRWLKEEITRNRAMEIFLCPLRNSRETNLYIIKGDGLKIDGLIIIASSEDKAKQIIREKGLIDSQHQCKLELLSKEVDCAC